MSGQRASHLEEPAFKMPESVKNNQILRQKIWNRLHLKNQNWMGGIVGETGNGKSWSALCLAEVLDPNFSIDQVAFTPIEFLELVQSEEYGKGSFIVFDEAGVGISNRDWYSEVNKQVGFVMDTWRDQNRGAIFTLPSLGGLDKKALGRLHGYIDMKGINYQDGVSLGKYYNIVQDTWSGQIYRKFPEFRKPGKNYKVEKKWIKFSTPSKELRKAYEEKVSKFKQDLAEEGFEKVQDEMSDDDGKDPKEVADTIISQGHPSEDKPFRPEKGEDSYAVKQNGEGDSAQYYIDRDIIQMDYNVSERMSKKIKKQIYRNMGLDVSDNWV